MNAVARLLLVAVVLSLSTPAVRAVPDSFFGNGFSFPVIPAHPRFGADLTEEFLDVASWETEDFPGPWEEEPALEGESVRRMTAMPVLFGNVPTEVRAHGEEGRLRELEITYLDAGTFFGFRLGGEKTRAERDEGEEKRAEFASYHRRIAQNLRERLEAGCGRGEQVVMGRSDLLRTVFTDFQWEGFVLRLATRDGHSVSLRLLRSGEVARDFCDAAVVGLSERERTELYAARVRRDEMGDVRIEGIPVYAQGNTPYCGIHSLAMVGRYYGLRVREGALAAAADLRNTGSSRGSKVFDLYYAAAEEVGMRAKVSSSFDFDRVQRAIEEGRPVIVWRRVSLERERAHAEFAQEYAANPGRRRPEPTAKERASWPEKEAPGSPSHASVVAGYNVERGEVILREPWGVEAGERRIRFEELEATGYAVFYFGI